MLFPHPTEVCQDFNAFPPFFEVTSFCSSYNGENRGRESGTGHGSNLCSCVGKEVVEESERLKSSKPLGKELLKSEE